MYILLLEYTDRYTDLYFFLVKTCLFCPHIVFVPTQGGWTALMWAAYKGRTDVADLLLEKGANPNITGQVLK